jgi:hypothetical protein
MKKKKKLKKHRVLIKSVKDVLKIANNGNL